MFKPTINAESFRKKSEKILGVFTQTKNDLQELVTEQESYRENLEAKVFLLNVEKSEVRSSIEENRSIIKKIEQFLS